MHPRVAARIGLKLIAIYLIIEALTSLAYSSWSLIEYFLYTRPQLQQQAATFGGGVWPGMNRFPRDLVFMVSPMLKLLIGAFIYFRADAIAKRIAPPTGRLCGDCGYDLKGIATDACPECGAPVRRAAAARSESREINEERNDNAPAFRPGR